MWCVRSLVPIHDPVINITLKFDPLWGLRLIIVFISACLSRRMCRHVCFSSYCSCSSFVEMVYVVQPCQWFLWTWKNWRSSHWSFIASSTGKKTDFSLASKSHVCAKSWWKYLSNPCADWILVLQTLSCELDHRRLGRPSTTACGVLPMPQLALKSLWPLWHNKKLWLQVPFACSVGGWFEGRPEEDWFGQGNFSSGLRVWRIRIVTNRNRILALGRLTLV